MLCPVAFTRTVLIVHNNPELFTEQIVGIVMDFTSIKLNGGFTIEKHFKALAKNDDPSAIADHVKATGHNIKWETNGSGWPVNDKRRCQGYVPYIFLW